MERQNDWAVMLKKRELIRERAVQILEKRNGRCCSYDRGALCQEIFHCRTCNLAAKGSGVCVACYFTCHLDHDVVEVGLKPGFLCDCGNDAMEGGCSLRPKEGASANEYNHNFTGKFCICDSEDSEERESSMFMCVLCFDWFHGDCIQVSNDSHNFTGPEHHLKDVPKVPGEEDSRYMFICYKCVNTVLFIPAGYREYIHFEKPVKRTRPGQCPLEALELPLKFAYSLFLSVDWLEARCSCARCSPLYTQFQHVPELGKTNILDEIERETERILDQEILLEDDGPEEDPALSGMSQEAQIELANGYHIFTETLHDFLTGAERETIELADIEEFKKQLTERYNSYKEDRTPH